MSDVGEREISHDERAVLRTRVEVGFGKRLRALIAEAGAEVATVARHLAKRRPDLYEIFEGEGHFRAAWLELLPPAVEQLYLRERAAAHRMELRPAGDPEAHPRALVDVVTALTNGVRVAAEGEADGALDPQEIDRELAAWEQVDKVRWARVAYLKHLRARRGGVVATSDRSRS